MTETIADREPRTGYVDVDGETMLTIGRLTEGNTGGKSSGWWGMWLLVISEASLFAYLLFSYFYFAVQFGRDWLPDQLLPFTYAIPGTCALLVGAGTMFFASYAIRRNWQLLAMLGILIAFAGGAIYIWLQFTEWYQEPFVLSSSSYSSIYFVITGFDTAHIFIGTVMLLFLAIWTGLGYFDNVRTTAISALAIYWYFVNLAWLGVFFTLYITPHLGLG